MSAMRVTVLNKHTCKLNKRSRQLQLKLHKMVHTRRTIKTWPAPYKHSSYRRSLAPKRRIRVVLVVNSLQLHPRLEPPTCLLVRAISSPCNNNLTCNKLLL